MNKGKKLMLAVLSVSLLTGCGGFSPDGNAVKVGKDGEITAAVIDKLDQSYYNAEELKKEVETAVSDYNTKAGEEKITIDKFDIKDTGDVKLYMKYVEGSDYAAFNNIDFYAGDITKGYNDAGYRFETTFQQVENGSVVKDNVDRQDIFKGENHPMIVFAEEMEVEVPGKILYASSNVEVTGKKTARMGGTDEKESETGSETASESENGTEVMSIAPEEVTAGDLADSNTTLAYVIYE